MKHSILKWSLLPILGLLIWGLVVVTNWANTVEFVWRWPVSFHKFLEIKKWEVISPEVAETPQDDNSIVLRVSHYNPDLGGVNCANFQDGVCVSKMANGERYPY